MKKILYLTNRANGDPEEDEYIIKKLSSDFDIVSSHPLECEKYLSSIDGIIIRNIWPTYEYAAEWKRIKSILIEKNISTYNSLSGKGDNNGKDYLLDLFKKDFPVIPSIDSIDDLHHIPESELYWIKPKEGCDGIGSDKLTKSQLKERDLRDYIIQPYVEFISEPSFFFVDNVFSYAISTSNRLENKKVESYEPTKDDLDFAQKFIDWNGLSHGIQRVDAVRTKEGALLLTEVEDIAPYLYLLDMDDKKREFIFGQLRQSMLNFFK